MGTALDLLLGRTTSSRNHTPVVRAHPEVSTRGQLVGPYISVGDERALELLRYGDAAGMNSPAVDEASVLGYPAFYRGVALIAGTIAGLPMRHLRTSQGERTPLAGTWVANPGAVMGRTQVEWARLTLVHAVLYNETIQLIVRGGAGQVVGLEPLNPGVVSVYKDPATGVRTYKVRLQGGGERELADDEVLHVVWMSVNGVRGLPLITTMRQSLGTALSGERAAAKIFANGLLRRTLVTPRDSEEMTDDEGQAVVDRINDESGSDSAGKPLWINRMVQLDPYSMTAEDAQFMESRAFQVEEVSRMLGVPPHLLMQTDKQTSWGTGVAEQNRGLARYTLMDWTTGLEQGLSLLLSAGQWVEFDYAGLLQGTPAEEIALLIAQVDAKLLTVDEARAIRNMGPYPEQTPADGDAANGDTGTD